MRSAARHLRAAARRRASSSGAALPPSWQTLCEGLPIVAGHAESAGRGLFALLDLPLSNAPLFVAAPAACHPPLHADVASRTCAVCLRSLPLAPVGGRFCSAACSSQAFLTVQRGEAWAAFEALAAARRSVFALLAGRLACRVALGDAHAGVLDGLCYANLAETPPPWAEEHAALLAALASSPALRGRTDLSWLTERWYASVLSRLHLNSFRVEPVRTDVTSLQALALHAAHGSGTAVYLLPSLLNHDCEPNLDAVWRNGDATMQLVARRPIAAGEQLTITYTDSSAPVAERRAELLHTYGFTCNCQSCREESDEA